MAIYPVLLRDIDFRFDRYRHWCGDDFIKHNYWLGLGQDVHILDFDDHCKSYHGHYLPSNLESEWIWSHQKINYRVDLRRFERSAWPLFVIDGRSR